MRKLAFSCGFQMLSDMGSAFEEIRSQGSAFGEIRSHSNSRSDVFRDNSSNIDFEGFLNWYLDPEASSNRGISICSESEALWRKLLDHLFSLSLLAPGGCLCMRSLQLCLRQGWDFKDDSFLVAWNDQCRMDLLLWFEESSLNQDISP